MIYRYINIVVYGGKILKVSCLILTAVYTAGHRTVEWRAHDLVHWWSWKSLCNIQGSGTCRCIYMQVAWWLQACQSLSDKVRILQVFLLSYDFPGSNLFFCQLAQTDTEAQRHCLMSFCLIFPASNTTEWQGAVQWNTYAEIRPTGVLSRCKGYFMVWVEHWLLAPGLYLIPMHSVALLFNEVQALFKMSYADCGLWAAEVTSRKVLLYQNKSLIRRCHTNMSWIMSDCQSKIASLVRQWLNGGMS